MTDRKLSSDEAKAWDRVRRSVRPLKSGPSPKIKRDVTDHPILKQVKPAKPPAKAGTQTGSGRVSRAEPAMSGPADRSKEKKVRRGKLDISASFDLHGHTQDSAWSALPAFLIREQARGSRCVIVITGKGKTGEGILRRNFLRWIEMPDASSLVSGYSPAHPKHGGSGAFYVFLRRR
ncbi:Smr/MutS family protein [Henriciella sp. AS95]|uniref:Smr/MutS family protein n=1 Tax=Henriciella sp. AS95 TaxID=3135782 RepID=UPI00317FC44D